jgi:flagellar hook assembly protein FlgD
VFSTSAILAISDARVYPNPFNPAFRNTTIAFGLSKDAQVEITAYDWAGAFVDRVFKGVGTAGANAVEWGGQTEDGRKLGNGVYLIRIVASTDARTESQVLKAVVWNEG